MSIKGVRRFREEVNMDYAQACAAHATAQGLDPITAELRAAGIHHYLWQSGGFCMVVVVPTGHTQAWLTSAEELHGGSPGMAYVTDGHICHNDYDNCDACEAEGYDVAFADIPERIRTLTKEV
jgi:hypothetical protein